MNKIKFLKVKLKSLAAESKIIRKEEKRAGSNELREALYLHRLHVVRSECRATHLAYGYLRGRAYRDLESKCKSYPDVKRIESMVSKYGSKDDIASLKEWLTFNIDVK